MALFFGIRTICEQGEDARESRELTGILRFDLLPCHFGVIRVIRGQEFKISAQS
jgi:hypothetical protein